MQGGLFGDAIMATVFFFHPISKHVLGFLFRGFHWRVEVCYPALGFSCEAIWTFSEKIRSTRCTATCRDKTHNFLSIWTLAVTLQRLVHKWSICESICFIWQLLSEERLSKMIVLSEGQILFWLRQRLRKKVLTPLEPFHILSDYNHGLQSVLLAV